MDQLPRDRHVDECPLIIKWLPHATFKERREAHADLDGFLEVVYAEFIRREESRHAKPSKPSTGGGSNRCAS
jgi:hypothetical protein